MAIVHAYEPVRIYRIVVVVILGGRMSMAEMAKASVDSMFEREWWCGGGRLGYDREEFLCGEGV